MSEFDTVIAAIDDSEIAHTVLRIATQLARLPEGGRLFAVHGVEPMPATAHRVLFPLACFGDDHDAFEAELLQVAAKALIERHSKALGTRPEETVRVAYGHPVEAVLQLAASLGPSLAVIGTAGTRASTPGRLGSTADALASRMPIPTLLVNRQQPADDIRRIGVAIDLTLESAGLLGSVATLAHRIGASVVPIHVTPTSDTIDHAGILRSNVPMNKIKKENRRLIAQVMERVEVAFPVERSRDELIEKPFFSTGDPAMEVLAAAEKLQLDAVALLRSRNDGGSGSRVGRVAGHIIRNAPCHALVVPPIDEGEAES